MRVGPERAGRSRRASFAVHETRGEPFDIALVRKEYGYGTAEILNCWFHSRNIPSCNNSWFKSARYNQLLDRAPRLNGPPSARLYGTLDIELAKAAPAIVITHPARAVIVSTRAGCHAFKKPLFDLASVCLKR